MIGDDIDGAKPAAAPDPLERIHRRPRKTPEARLEHRVRHRARAGLYARCLPSLWLMYEADVTG